MLLVCGVADPGFMSNLSGLFAEDICREQTQLTFAALVTKLDFEMFFPGIATPNVSDMFLKVVCKLYPFKSHTERIECRALPKRKNIRKRELRTNALGRHVFVAIMSTILLDGIILVFMVFPILLMKIAVMGLLLPVILLVLPVAMTLLSVAVAVLSGWRQRKLRS